MKNLPTPLEVLLDPISLIIIGMFLALYLWETIWPRNKNLPFIKYATLRGISTFVLFFFISTYLPLFTDEYLSAYLLFNLSHLSVLFQVIYGLLIYELLLYGWHRAMHSSNNLWKIFHQMHHSSERLDIPSAFYFSPTDMIGFTLLGSVCFALLIGLQPQAITIIILLLNFLSLFQHANISTPKWLGYLIQRPEQHAIHHGRGIHRYNYCDLPIYDIIFGTFKNPKNFDGFTGFYDGASAKVIEMISFKDLNK